MEVKKNQQQNADESSFFHGDKPNARTIKAQIFSLFEAGGYTKEAALKLQALFTGDGAAVTH